MAQHNKAGENNGANVVENINDRLTEAGGKLATHKNFLYWTLGSVVLVVLIILAWFWFYENPKNANAITEWQKVMMSEDNDTVKADNYKKVAEKFGNRAGGNIAALQAAQTYYRLDKYNEALECLNKFNTSEPLIKAQAEIMKGDCYVNLDNLNEALACYNKALKIADGNPTNSPLILWKEARVYEAQKDYKKARECYETIKAQYPQFNVGNNSLDFYIERSRAAEK